MKIILTNAEACAVVATRYSVCTNQVEIESKPSEVAKQFAPVTENGITCPNVRESLRLLFDEGQIKGYGATRPNKIALIKAVRGLTDCSLKEGKDFVEQELLKEYPSF